MTYQHALMPLGFGTSEFGIADELSVSKHKSDSKKLLWKNKLKGKCQECSSE